MRSNPVAKPPPPIPPRPSKLLVAEALAKSRGTNRTIEDAAPLPAFCNGFLPVTKSQSYSTFNVINKAAAHIQRSTSSAAEKKENSRTVIFHSSNAKTSKAEVKLSRNDSGCDVKYIKSSNVLINLENNKNKECNTNRNNSLNNEKNHVNELIDEMFASILDIPDADENVDSPEAYNDNVNVPKQTESPVENESETNEKPLKIDDKMNHEFLISELESMHKVQKRRPPPLDFSDDNIHRSDWVEVNDGQEVRLSRCEIIIDDCDIDKDADITADDVVSRLNMSAYGLPPLPKSLSGFSLNPQTPSRITPPGSGFVPSGYPSHPRLSNGAASESPGRSPTNLDNQLAILRREMYGLRQLDLSLLSQLWSLNESIQEFRQILQEQDDRGLSPPSPSPSPSSCDDGETDEFFSPSPIKLRPAPPPPPLRRTSNSSSANSSEYGTV